MNVVGSAVAEGLSERKMAREKSAAEKKAKEDAIAAPKKLI